MLTVGQVIRTKLDQGQEQETSFARLREVPSIPLRAGRHLTAWILWHTARRSTLTDLTAPQPPEESMRTRRRQPDGLSRSGLQRNLRAPRPPPATHIPAGAAADPSI